MAVVSNFFFWLVDLEKSSLKLHGQIKPNFTGCFYGRFSIRFPNFIMIGQKSWSRWAILISDWLKFRKSGPLTLGGTMNWYFVGMMYGGFCTKLPYFVLIVQLIWPSCAVLACGLKKKSSLKPLGQIN